MLTAIKETLESGASGVIRCSSASNGQYFADPADCRKFYKCVNGEILSDSCAPCYAFSMDVHGNGCNASHFLKTPLILISEFRLRACLHRAWLFIVMQ